VTAEPLQARGAEPLLAAHGLSLGYGEVAVHHGRGPLAKAAASLNRAEVTTPHQFPFEVIAVQPRRSEPRKQPLAVGHR
jgi:hypothetical protein